MTHRFILACPLNKVLLILDHNLIRVNLQPTSSNVRLLRQLGQIASFENDPIRLVKFLFFLLLQLSFWLHAPTQISLRIVLVSVGRDYVAAHFRRVRLHLTAVGVVLIWLEHHRLGKRFFWLVLRFGKGVKSGRDLHLGEIIWEDIFLLFYSVILLDSPIKLKLKWPNK